MKFRLMKLNAINMNCSYMDHFEIEKYLVLRYDERPILCCIDPLNHNRTVNMELVSHTLNDLRIEGNYLVGDIVVLDTPEGSKLRDMIADNYSFAASYYSIVSIIDDIQYPFYIHNIRCFPTNTPSFD